MKYQNMIFCLHVEYPKKKDGLLLRAISLKIGYFFSKLNNVLII